MATPRNDVEDLSSSLSSWSLSCGPPADPLPQPGLQSLPRELLLKVLASLPGPSVAAVRCTARRLRDATGRPPAIDLTPAFSDGACLDLLPWCAEYLSEEQLALGLLIAGESKNTSAQDLIGGLGRLDDHYVASSAWRLVRPDDLAVAAARRGYLSVITRMVGSSETGASLKRLPAILVWPCSACVAAARGGHLHVLEYLTSQPRIVRIEGRDRESFMGSMLDEAAEHGRVDVVRFLISGANPEVTFFASAYDRAALNGHLHVLKLLASMDRPGSSPRWSTVFGYATGKGRVDMLDWVRDEGGLPYCDLRDGCYRAAWCGSLEAYRWLLAAGAPGLSEGWHMAAAAGGGNLEIVRLAREGGCPWDEETCAAAAGGGHLDVLRWARENGCPWDKASCAWLAARRSNPEVLRWINGS